jgi:hypothetical protein
MKKFSVCALVAAMFILLSCSERGFAVHKRQYRSGYYFAGNTSVDKTNQLPAKQKNNPTAKNKTGQSDNIAESEMTSVHVRNDELKFQTTAEGAIKLSETKIRRHSFIKKAENNFIRFKTAAKSRVSELSFMWIVVVVLLALYVGGLVTGGPAIGGMIHLLLVLALVLAVLWLLRVF